MARTLDLLAQAIPQGLNAFANLQSQQLQNQNAVNQMLRQEAADRLQRQKFEADQAARKTAAQPLDLSNIDLTNRKTALQSFFGTSPNAQQAGKFASLLQLVPADQTAARKFDLEKQDRLFEQQEKLERIRQRGKEAARKAKQSATTPFGFKLVPGALPEQISRKDAQNVKEAYSEAAAVDSLLSKIKKELAASGTPGFLPSKSKDRIKSLIAGAVTSLNKSEGLGALAGPDLKLLQEQLGNVDSISSMALTSAGLRSEQDLIERIDDARNNLFSKLDAKARTIGLERTAPSEATVNIGKQSLKNKSNNRAALAAAKRTISAGASREAVEQRLIERYGINLDGKKVK